MRLKLALIALVVFYLLLIGFRPDAMPYLRHDVRYSDAVLAHWPNAVFFRESVLERGEFPVWRETTMGGVPFAANPLNKTAYPFQWLVLLLPPSLHLNFLILLHLFIAGSGMWIWARSLRLRMEAAWLAAGAYVFAPRMMGHLGAGHLDVLYAMAWWPWLMASVSGAVRGAWRDLLQISVLAALLLLADVRVSLFAFSTAALYALIEIWRTGRWWHVWRFALAGLLLLILTASLIIPLLLWQPYMSRDQMSAADAGVLSLNPAHFLGLILPTSPPGIETLTYFGLPVLALALVAAVGAGKKTLLVLLGIMVLIAVYAMGTNGFLWPPLVKLLPGLLWFRVPARAWLVLVLLLPLTAAYGLHWLLNHIDDWRSGHLAVSKRLKLGIVACMAIVIAFGLFALFILRLPPDIGLTTLFSGVVVGGLLLAGLNGRLTTHQISILVFAVTVLDLGVNAYRWVEWRGSDQWLDPQRPLAERLVELEADRIYSPTYSLEQQTAELYNLRLFGGVDPFQLIGVVDAVERGSGVKIDGYGVVLPPVEGAGGDDLSQANRDAIIDTQILAEWKVSHVVAAYKIDNPRLAFVDTVNGVSIYKNLDYRPSEQPASIPDWPSGWPGLPDETTVNRFNQITLIAALVSAAAFFICAALLILTQLRHKRV